MRKRKRSLIQITPLLDIVLLLLFALMLQLSVQNENNSREQMALKEQLTTKEDTIQSLKQEKQDLSENIKYLQAEIANSEYKIELLSDANKAILKGLESFLNISEPELNQLLSASDPSTVTRLMNEFSDPTQAGKALYLYQELVQKFYFIDIIVVSNTNQLIINNTTTDIHVILDADATPTSINYMKQKIKDGIEKEIKKRKGGSALLMATLQLGNEEVYHYAWSLIWDCLGELEQKYGPDTFYRVDIPWIKTY